MKALSNGTDCYPAREVEALISKDTVNQAFMVNPRNAYQNYNVAVNQSAKKMYTYMGTLLPNIGNASYSTSGQLSPLLKDPELRTIGIGTRIFIGGTEGYIIWEGTQCSPGSLSVPEKEIVTKQGISLSVIGDLKKMSPDFIQAAYLTGYGVSLFVGIGIPIPILDEDMLKAVSRKDEEIFTEIFDYSCPHPDKPSLGLVSYSELRSGEIELKGKKVPTSSMSSYAKARDIAQSLKEKVQEGLFFLQEPVERLVGQTKLQRLKTIKIY